jgi:glyoxylase-like metal-dependent hydrolase (beta-lactamase superfamily II)
MSTWKETAEGVFTRRFDPVDVTVTAVLGGEGVLVVDTRCSVQEGEELRAELAKLTPLPVRWVVNTHVHFDHMWGNAAFDAPSLEPPAQFWGHREMPDYDPDDPEFHDLRDRLLRDGGPEWKAKLDTLVIRKPDHLVSASHALDLGGRVIELLHPGRGHTGHDLVLWLPDAELLIGGDLVEQSGPVAYGSDSFPLDWPATLGALAALTTEGTTYVPGHGDPSDRRFLADSQAFVTAVADQVRVLHAEGVPVEQAVAAGTWPIENAAHFADAVARGYAQLSGALA